MNRPIVSSLCHAPLFVFAVEIAFGLAVLCAGSNAFSQIATGTTAAAMGGAGRAAVDAGENSWLNPAALTQARGYFFGAHGSIADHAITGNQKQYGLVAADNEADQLGAGSLSYIHTNNSRSQGNLYTQDIQAAAAAQVLSNFSVGVAVHRLSQAVSVGTNQTQYNATLGVLWTPVTDLGFGLVGYDLIPQGHSIPDDLRLIPTIAFGSDWIIKKFLQVRLDFSHPLALADGRTDVMAGLGTYFDQNFAFRFGTDWKETKNETWLTAGVGFTGPKLSVDYAFQKDIRQAEGHRHSIDLWMPF